MFRYSGLDEVVNSNKPITAKGIGRRLSFYTIVVL